jgi:hypothetical protein
MLICMFCTNLRSCIVDQIEIECKNVFLDEPSNQILFHVTIWYWEHAWGFMKLNQRYTFHVYQNSDVSSSIETLATMLFQLCTECGWSQNHILHRHVSFFLYIFRQISLFFLLISVHVLYVVSRL